MLASCSHWSGRQHRGTAWAADSNNRTNKMETGEGTWLEGDTETPEHLSSTCHLHSDELPNSFSCPPPRRKENPDPRFSLENLGGSQGETDTVQPSQPHSKSIFQKNQHSQKVKNYTRKNVLLRCSVRLPFCPWGNKSPFWINTSEKPQFKKKNLFFSFTLFFISLLLLQLPTLVSLFLKRWKTR